MTYITLMPVTLCFTMVTDRLPFFLWGGGGINWPITVTDFNCLGINSGVADTDLVVLSTIFPGPMT